MFLPVESVGVVGYARAYEWVIQLRTVETIYFMTANWAHLPYGLARQRSAIRAKALQGSSNG